MAVLANLIDVADLSEHEGAKFIDVTWLLPGEADTLTQGAIPGAVFFDLGKLKTLPLKDQTPDTISGMLGQIGIRHMDEIVIYDRKGVFSAPRLWWLLKRVGHKKLSILNGGLPAYKAAGLPIEKIHANLETRHYQPLPPLLSEAVFGDMLTTDAQIVDARPSGRFYGTEPEPRPNLRSGHIPTAISLPYGSLIQDDLIRSDKDLAEAVGAAGVNLDKPIITTCGSGVTAAGLAFILTRLGAKDVRVYTGSWAEYGASDAPVETI